MLGLADRTIVMELFEAALRGDARGSLEILGTLHAAGADPGTIVEDLLDLTHAMTRMRLAPGAAGTRADIELKRGSALAEKLGMPVLTRAWQLLLKGMGEINVAPNPHAAAEMVVLRLVYAADLPTPGDLVKRLQQDGPSSADSSRATQSAPPPSAQPSAMRPEPQSYNGGGATAMARQPAEPIAELIIQPAAQLPEPAPPPALPDPRTYKDVVKLFAEKREGIFEFHLASSVRVVRFEPGVIEINPLPAAPSNLANRVGALLSEWTGRRWVVGISAAVGESTIVEVEQAERNAALDSARESPIVQALMEAFPQASIVDVRDLARPPVPDEDAGDQTYPADSGDITLENGDEP
jgi:DNA polymerase-3 subunit gamma/tau